MNRLLSIMNKRMFVILLFLILFINILLIDINLKKMDDFDVIYYEKYSSSSGDRIINITYQVRKNEIVFCKGFYLFDGNQENKINKTCNLTKLKNQEHPFYLQKLITEYNKMYEKNYEFKKGPNYFKYTIIPI